MQNPKDVGHQLKCSVGIVATNEAAGTINGTGVDRMAQGSREGFDSCVLFGQCGAASGTPTTQAVDFKLQDSADNSSFADLSAAVQLESGTSSLTQQVADSGSQQLNINLRPCRRYIRAVCTVAFTGGSTPKIPVSATLILGGSHHTPPT